MTDNVRRVVTGHDKDGRAVVTVDEIVQNIGRPRPGQSGALIWAIDQFPIDINDGVDGGARPGGPVKKGGAAFRITTFDPGVSPRHHRTESVDFAVVLSGQIDVELDDTSVRLKAGDCLVQRGTIHNWANPGPDKCVMAFFVIGTDPVRVGDQVLGAKG